MGQRLRQIATATTASAGALILMSCTNHTDAPATFATTVTVTGEADQASADSGICTFGATRLAPNDEVGIYGERAYAVARSTLEVESIDQHPDGTGECKYKAHFDAVPANQRSYQLFVGNDFVEKPFTSNDFQNGITYVVPSFAP